MTADPKRLHKPRKGTMLMRCLERSTALAIVLMAVPSFAQAPQPDLSWTRPEPREAWLDRFQEQRAGPEQVDRFSRTIRIGRSGSFELSNITGDIVVTAVGGEELMIEAVKRVRARDESAKRSLAELTIEVNERSGRVEVRTNYPRGRGSQAVSVDYTVRVPADTSVWVRSVSGDIQVTGVGGEQRLESVSGNVRSSKATRLAQAKSVSGDVEIVEVASDSELVAATVSGGLTARGVKARGIEVSTVSGDLVLDKVACDRAIVHTVSGTLEYAGSLAKHGRYEMNSHSGDLRLTVGQDTGFELEAGTFSGSIRSDLPLTYEGQRGDRHREELRDGRQSRAVRATYGDGSASVELRTFSGDIVIAGR